MVKTHRSGELPSPQGLLTFGKIWVIQSLNQDDMQTGRRLRENVETAISEKNVGLSVRFRDVQNRTQLCEVLDEIYIDCFSTGTGLILHVDCHGADDSNGLVLANGDFVPWDELKKNFEAINTACRFNLLLVLACCLGAYFMQTTRLQERAAFCACLAPPQRLNAGILLNGYSAVYRELLSGKNISLALDRVRSEVPNFPFYFITAEYLFRLACISYFTNHCTPTQLRERAENIIKEQQRRGISTYPTIESAVGFLEKRAPIYFEDCRRTYFGINDFPENDERYVISYDSIRSDAEST